jgi:hypothetical protein
MLQSVRGYFSFGVQILEKGLAHPSFLGRAVSWGIFYGALYLCAKKIYQYALPKIKEYIESRKCCDHNCGPTLRGEPVTPIIPERNRQESKREILPIRTQSQPGQVMEGMGILENNSPKTQEGTKSQALKTEAVKKK